MTCEVNADNTQGWNYLRIRRPFCGGVWRRPVPSQVRAEQPRWRTACPRLRACTQLRAGKAKGKTDASRGSKGPPGGPVKLAVDQRVEAHLILWVRDKERTSEAVQEAAAIRLAAVNKNQKRTQPLARKLAAGCDKAP